MSETPPTPEELEAARLLLAAHNAAEAAAKRAATRALLAPLAEAGFGGTGPLMVSVQQAAALMRDSMNTLAPLDRSLAVMAFSGAQVLEIFNDRVRSLIAQNAEPETVTPEPVGD